MQKNKSKPTPVEGVKGYDMDQTKNNMATASMVLGIISIVTICCCLGFVLGGLAVLFAGLSMVNSQISYNYNYFDYYGYVLAIGILLTGGLM